jgi:type IV pilus assembly protein PilA
MRRQQQAFTLVELLVVVAILAILVAIAVPSLQRARVAANESAMTGDLRTVVSAEAAYFSASGGFYGIPACLAEPSAVGCIPSYPTSSPTFLDSHVASLAPKSGYARSFTAPAASMSCFVYGGTPVTLGQTGVRGFFADCSGRLCYSADGSVVTIVDGALGPDCLMLK